MCRQNDVHGYAILNDLVCHFRSDSLHLIDMQNKQ